MENLENSVWFCAILHGRDRGRLFLCKHQVLIGNEAKNKNEVCYHSTNVDLTFRAYLKMHAPWSVGRSSLFQTKRRAIEELALLDNENMMLDQNLMQDTYCGSLPNLEASPWRGPDGSLDKIWPVNGGLVTSHHWRQLEGKVHWPEGQHLGVIKGGQVTETGIKKAETRSPSRGGGDYLVVKQKRLW